ncbi:MAG TPA: CAP domain-containing protein [Gemmataceae bacterium]|nr:CAP domain-containing protein [Gemmataceae bacterium]
MRIALISLVLIGGAWQTAVSQQKDFKLSDAEQKLLDLTNAERAKEKLPPLKFNPVLCEVARAHSANMAKQGKLEHELDGKTPFERIKATGYKYSMGGENVARHRAGLEEVMAGWMKSPGHRDNILSNEYTEIGMGAVTDAKGFVYYTQVFAKPRK